MKINVPVRMKNPWFWVSLVSVILTALNVAPETFTSWPLVWAAAIDLLCNPFKLGCVFVAVLGVFVDPTTAGLTDSMQALTYKAPKKGE